MWLGRGLVSSIHKVRSMGSRTYCGPHLWDCFLSLFGTNEKINWTRQSNFQSVSNESPLEIYGFLKNMYLSGIISHLRVGFSMQTKINALYQSLNRSPDVVASRGLLGSRHWDAMRRFQTFLPQLT